MARPRSKIDVHGQTGELLEKLSGERPGWRRERLLALKLILEGRTIQSVATDLGRSPMTLHNWISKFREAGLDGLLSKSKGNGPASSLTPEMQQAMVEELRKGQWRTARDAWTWLKENFESVTIKEATVYKYLGKCAGRLKATRPCNPNKDVQQEEAFRVSLAEKMEQLELPAESKVRLWVYDEMRYGLHPLTRKMWCLRGVRAIAPSRRRYQNGYLYGALEVAGESGSEFLLTPELNKQWDRCFLEQISRGDTESIHVVIGDGAGFHHRAQEEQLPSNVRIITLPAYCPELNPAEKLWDILKDGLWNIDWPDLEALEERIIERLRPYWEHTQRVTRLIGSSYLVSELNAMNESELIQFNH